MEPAEAATRIPASDRLPDIMTVYVSLSLFFKNEITSAAVCIKRAMAVIDGVVRMKTQNIKIIRRQFPPKRKNTNLDDSLVTFIFL